MLQIVICAPRVSLREDFGSVRVRVDAARACPVLMVRTVLPHCTDASRRLASPDCRRVVEGKFGDAVRHHAD